MVLGRSVAQRRGRQIGGCDDRVRCEGRHSDSRPGLPDLLSGVPGDAGRPEGRGSGSDFSGVAAFFNGPAAQSFGYEGADSLQYKTGVAEFRVSAGSFFQVNRFLVDDLVKTATAHASGSLAWDLYAGVGLFSATLEKTFERVIAVEAGTASADDLKHNAPRAVKAIQATTEAFLNSKGKRPKPDFILVDPPRAGLGQAVARRLAGIEAGAISYVSCDPATLARDLRVLLDSGYKIEQIHLADLFPQTFHIETIVRLSR